MQVTGVSRYRNYEMPSGVKIEGWDPQTRVLTDAKNDYAQFVDPTTGKWYAWWSGQAKLIKEATEQLAAVQGTGIRVEWVASDQQTASALRNLLNQNNITQITVKVAGSAADDSAGGASAGAAGPVGGAIAGAETCRVQGPC